MAIKVEKARGMSEAQAVLEASSNGLMVFVQHTAEGATEPPHWHKWDTHLYLIEGEFRNLDPDNPDLVLEPGDYCVVEKETIHAGLSALPSTIVLGFTSELLGGITIQQDPADLI